MRWLPSSRRDVWQWAAVVWLAGCAIIWAVLPFRPRAVVPAPDAGFTVGCTADGRWAFAYPPWLFDPSRDVEQLSGPAEADGAFRAWDVETGHCRLTWAPTTRVYAFHPAQLLAVVPAGESDDPGVALLDLMTGRRDEVPWPIPGPQSEATCTADGRYLVVAMEDPGRAETFWWDRAARRTVGRFPGLTPHALAPDGRWVTYGDRPTELCIRAPASPAVLTKLDRPGRWAWASFSPDGVYLVVGDAEGTDIVEAASGRACAHLPGGPAPLVLSAARQAVVLDYLRDPPIRLGVLRWDLATGQLLGRQELAAVAPHWAANQTYLLPAKGQYLYKFGGGLPPPLFQQVLSRVPCVKEFVNSNADVYALYDAATGRELARFQPGGRPRVDVSPDGHTLLAMTEERLGFWDLPPRKPLTWLAVAAPLWALPLAWLARRRARRLPSAV